MFNVHGNKTADGVLITIGLEVFDNNLDVGKVIGDDSDLTGREDLAYKCCGDEGHKTGQTVIGSNVFSNHQQELSGRCFGCRHDHWFKIETNNGTKSMNGERLATIFQGKRAKADW